MSKTAFIFPGQGSQSVGMLGALADESPAVAQTFAQASEILGYDLWDICQNGPEERLNSTATTQPAMLAAGIATWRCWKENGGETPDSMAGHSLGEYSALVAAGVMSFEDAIATVALRGKLMQAAVPAGVGAMAAIIGLDDRALAELCEQQAQDEIVSCANFNSPGQVVIAGHKKAVERVCESAPSAGARRAIPLAVSVPSHCALMKPAAVQLEAALGQLQLEAPRIPVVQNVDVQVHDDSSGIVDALSRQLWQPVRWTETIGFMKEQGVEKFLECGPGKVLAGLNRRITRESQTVALIDRAALSQALERSES